MPLSPGDLMFVGWDADSEDVAFVATTNIAAGEIIYFTDDEWNGSNFLGSEQLFEWTVPAGGVSAGTVVSIDMQPSPGATATFSAGGDVDYIRGGGQLATSNEMLWAFQGDRVGNNVTPTDFVAVIANEADGGNTQTPNLSGTGLTTSNGAIIIDGDEDYMEFTADDTLPSPVTRSALIEAISDTSNWTTADGSGNSNPNPGGGFDVDVPTVVCFARGTRIETIRGPRCIEELTAGDLIQTLDRGYQPILWIGHQIARAIGAHHAVQFDQWAIGNDTSLIVSKHHRILLEGGSVQLMFGEEQVLAPAAALIDGQTIRSFEADRLDLFHILLPRHEIVFANGVRAESLFLADEARKSITPKQFAEASAALNASFPNKVDQIQTARPCLTFLEAVSFKDAVFA